MTTKHLNNLFLATAVAASLSLSACGGGGSGSSPVATAPAPAPAPAPVPAPTNPDLVGSVTVPTYAAGTVEKGAWSVLLEERAACGFGLVQQDTRLDAANAAHAKFLTDLSIATKVSWAGHGEDSSKPGFTGLNALDRAIFQGFPSAASVDEIVSADTALHSISTGDQVGVSEAHGADSMRRLMGTVYHLSGAMFAGRLGGVGSSHASTAYDTTTTFEVYRFGALIAVTDSNPQRLGTGVVATYPCAAATHASATFAPATESPNPFADVTSSSVIYGTPVYLKVDASSVLMVSSATITRVSDSSLLTVRQVTHANDPAGQVGANEFFMVPTAPLIVGAAYAVSVTGTVDGVAFTKTFSFTPQT